MSKSQLQPNHAERDFILSYRPWPADEGYLMQFNLLYKGPLPANGGVKDKHAIRRVIHAQLREFWKRDPLLSVRLNSAWYGDNADLRPRGQSYAESLAINYALGEFRFLPLITTKDGLACAIDVLMLRRDQPGGMVSNSGDLDNRLKTLFDALQRPTENDALRGCHPEADEDPFYCLLENDRLITDVRIRAEQLLSPVDTEPVANVFLLIHVKVLVQDRTKAALEFWETKDEGGYGKWRPATSDDDLP